VSVIVCIPSYDEIAAVMAEESKRVQAGTDRGEARNCTQSGCALGTAAR
jgi:hypothetical protein